MISLNGSEVQYIQYEGIVYILWSVGDAQLAACSNDPNVDLAAIAEGRRCCGNYAVK